MAAPIDTTVSRAFHKANIATVDQITQWLSCSVPTARRRLKSWRTLTSYNHNGRYYTLPDIPRFDDHGLWHFQGVGFSRHGNLTQTLVHLVGASPQGLSAAESGRLLGLQPRSFLSHFRQHPALARREYEGRWIWLAADPLVQDQQWNRRLTARENDVCRMPSDFESVMILVDLIRHPNSELEAVAHRLNLQGLTIDQESIRTLLLHYDLLKKTVVLPPSDT